MDRDGVLSRCRSLAGAQEGYPFNETALVFKVRGKMFAAVHMGDGQATVSLKCDPGYAEALRERFPAVTAGYHLNKRHWNTIVLDGTVPDDLLAEWIQDSYELVKPSARR